MMSELLNPAIEVAIFIVGQLVMLGITVATVKSDTRVLKVRLDAMQNEMTKVTDVMVTLATQKGEINLINERMLAQGKRLDDLGNRCSQHFDRMFFGSTDNRDHRV